MEVLVSNYIENCRKIVKLLENCENCKFRYVESDYSAYIDFMRCKAQRLPVFIKDGCYFQSSNIKKIKDFINGKIKGEVLK